MTNQYIYKFSGFTLDPAEHVLLRDGTPVDLTEKAFQVLLVLASRSGHLVEKSELVNAVWGDTCIEEGNLTVTISMLRKALNDDRRENKLIETIVKKGYRFLPAVSKIPIEATGSHKIADEPEEQPLEVISAQLADAAVSPRMNYSRWATLALALLLAVITWEQIHMGVAAVRSQAKVGRADKMLQFSDAESDSRRLAASASASHDFAARQLYIEGRYYTSQLTEAGLRRSIECFQQAIAKDPNYAEAYAGLADSYSLLPVYSAEPAEGTYANAKAAAEKSIQLNASLPEGHTSLGIIALYYEWNWQQADREFRKALDLNPAYSGAYTWDSLYLAITGNTSESLRRSLASQQLDPLSMDAELELGRAYYWDRQLDKAAATFRHVVARYPGFARAHAGLGTVLAAQQNYAEAIYEFHEAIRWSGPNPYADGIIGYANARSGNTKEARRILNDLIKRSQHEYIPAFSMAILYVGLGDNEKAMDWLDRARQGHSTYMVFARIDPLLDPLRSDKRFIALLTDINSGGELQAQNTSSLSMPERGF